MGKIHLEVVTPARKVFAGTCDEVYAPGVNGEFGVLPDHAAMVSELTSGVLRAKEGSSDLRLALRGGFVQVLANQVMVLADEAASPQEIDKVALAAETSEMDRKMIDPAVGPEEREKLLSERGWLEARQAASS